MNAEQKCFSLLAELFGIDPTLVERTDLLGELGIDSLEVIHLVLALERLAVRPISDEELRRLMTVNDVIDWIDTVINVGS